MPKTPIKLGPNDNFPLWERIRASHGHDRAPWGVLADSMEESNKPWAAHVIRTIFNHGQDWHVNGEPYLLANVRSEWPNNWFANNWGKGESYFGRIHGVPFRANRIYKKDEGKFYHNIHLWDDKDDYEKGTMYSATPEEYEGLKSELGYPSEPDESDPSFINIHHPGIPKTVKYEAPIPYANPPSRPLQNAMIATPKTLSGEHEQTASAIKDLFGHDPDGVPAWQATNNILSTDMPYKQHTQAATGLVADWLSARKPSDPSALDHLIKLNGDYGSKHKGIVEALANICSVRDKGHPARQMKANFGGDIQLPYSSLLGASPVDVHLSRGLYQPAIDEFEGRSDILTQAKAKLSDANSLSERQANILKQYPIKSKLVSALSKLPPASSKSPYSILKRLSNSLENRPAFNEAYKEAIDRASALLGWSKDQVQESVYMSLLGLIAHKLYGIPADKVAEYLNIDAIGKGWKSHESVSFPDVVNAYDRAITKPKTVQRMEGRAYEGAERNSRPGIVPNSARPRFGSNNASLSPIIGGIGDRIRQAVLKKLGAEGIYDPKTGKMKTAKVGEPLKLAHYDQELDFVPALQRAVSSNHQLFIDHLKGVLQRAGIQPQNLMPAVHDLGRAARVGVVAMGERLTPHANLTGAAWTGLLGRQPGMVSFTAHPNGKDSIYSFSHPDANAVRSALDSAGVTSRVLAPAGNTYHVFLYDKDRQHRRNVAQALSQLGTTAEEWWGNGEVVGGKRSDMGRDQYRNTINKAEQAQAQPQQFRRAFALHMARMTGDHEAFRAAIDAAPHDDAPKLVYSDFLQEQGNDEDANRWRMMAQHPGDEDFRPKGYIAPININVGPQLRDKVGHNAIDDGSGRFRSPHSYLSTDVPHEQFMGALKYFDPSGIMGTDVEPVASLPLTSLQANHIVGTRGYLGAGSNPLNIVRTGSNDYLVGKPTEIFDKLKSIEQFTHQVANSPRLKLIDRLRTFARNRQNRQRVGLE